MSLYKEDMQGQRQCALGAYQLNSFLAHPHIMGIPIYAGQCKLIHISPGLFV